MRAEGTIHVVFAKGAVFARGDVLKNALVIFMWLPF